MHVIGPIAKDWANLKAVKLLLPGYWQRLYARFLYILIAQA